MGLPRIEGKGNEARLVVNDRPFVAYAGEVHNSSSSSLEYMEEKVWPALRPLHMNAVVMPVFWEVIEPEEGVFDFEIVDGLIAQARNEGMKIIFLWFGLWKNGASTYVPAWVKLDQRRFFHVVSTANLSTMGIFGQGKNNNLIDTISPLCEAASDADAKAFRALMAHIRDIDAEEQTVIMMQIENEIGVLGSARDTSAIADAAFESVIPDRLAEACGVAGTWREAFGNEAEENFMCWYYGRAVEKIAAAGTEEYPIPMYVNAWLEQFPEMAGAYPSGGPVAKKMDIWRIAAPTIQVYGPDIYVDNYRDVCDEYASNGNPLLIPEVRATEDTAAFAFYAYGKHNAMCFSPFGIEDLFASSVEAMSAEQLAQLNIGEGLIGKQNQMAGVKLAAAYQTLASMEGLMDEARAAGKLHAFLEYKDQGQLIETENYLVKITYGAGSVVPWMRGKSEGPAAGGILIEDGDTFYLAGQGVSATFYPKNGEQATLAVLRKEEGHFEDGVWKRGRILNGDEGMRIGLGAIPEVQKVTLFKIWN